MATFRVFFHSHVIVAILNKLAIVGTPNDGEFLSFDDSFNDFFGCSQFHSEKRVFTTVACQNLLHNVNEKFA
jgi:hypothetical protein